MAKSTWDKSLETGNEMIDSQHKQVIYLVDNLEKAHLKSDEDVLNLLNDLMEFTIVHFISEEELMDLVKYPSEPKKYMIDSHREFKDYMRLRILEFREEKSLNIISFQSFITKHLINHEFVIDMEFVDWMHQQKVA